MSDQQTIELRRCDGDPTGVDQQKDTKRAGETLSHTLGAEGPTSASLPEAMEIVRRYWLDPSYSPAEVGEMIGRSSFVAASIAVAAGFARQKPFSQRARHQRQNSSRPEDVPAKLWAIKKAEQRDRAEAARVKAEAERIAAIYARIGNYTDDPRASPPQPFRPNGWEPRPVAERLRFSPVGCAAAMAAGN